MAYILNDCDKKYNALDIPVGMTGLEHFTSERRMRIRYVDIYLDTPQE